MKEKERFWNVDLKLVLVHWWQDISVFLMTLVAFMALSLPVVIPALILWYLMSINFTVAP